MKKLITYFCFFVLFVSSLMAIELSLRVAPVMGFPSYKNEKGEKEYEQDLGVNAHLDVSLFNILNVGIEGGYDCWRPKGLDTINVGYAGLGLGAYYYPISRLYLGLGGAGGMYLATTTFPDKTADGQKKQFSANQFYYRAYGEVGFRVNPSFTVSATGGYASYLVPGSHALHSSPFAGVSAKVNFDVGSKGSGNVDASIDLYDDIFPLFMQLYRTASAGTIKITNFESAEIRNVKVSFRAGKYTSSAMECASIPLLQKFKSQEIPFIIDFSDEILNISEDGAVAGEIVIDYELLGKKKVSVENVVLNVHNKNAFSWSDPAALAAFISPDTPEVLAFAKYCAGISRNILYTGMNRNIQFTAAIFEGLRAAGITYSQDVGTPYVQYHTGTEMDSIQYPLQTMDCLSGDYDDLGILMAACLESIGIPTAVIPYDDDFILLVSIDVKPELALNHFASEDSILVDDTDVYFALSMASFEKGFTESRKVGSKKLANCKADTEGKYEYLNTHLAWELYPPVVYSKGNSTFENPNQTALEKSINNVIKAYIDSDLSIVIEKARKSGNDNKLGVALVRAGKYAEAKEAFNRAAKTGSLSAMNNVANVYMYEKNYAAAAAQYKKVLDKDPSNKTAKKGLENANGKLEV